MNALVIQNAVIQTIRLTKKYGECVAVDNLDLEIYQGEIFGFLGPNGAGKTTSISMICGLLKPTSGQIRINGNVTNEHAAYRRNIGLCPQEVILWPKLSCLEQLIFMGGMYGLPVSKSRKSAIELLDKLGLSEKRNQLAGTLSGGMKRRLNVCLALIHDPEIVVLDEPEAGLDPQSRVMTREFIRSLRLKKTIVLTTHNMDEAERLSDRVAIIDYGRLLITDTPENLKRTAGEGDVIEIAVRHKTHNLVQRVAAALEPMSVQFTVTNESILIRKKAAIDFIPEIIRVLAQHEIVTGEIKMRANTLEDVFIHLTGRSLRE